MAEAHDIGKRHYWHTMNVPARGPLATSDFTYEIDDPYRMGRALILRAPFTGWCLVVGHWVGRVPEEEALRAGAQMRDVDADAQTVRGWTRVR